MAPKGLLLFVALLTLQTLYAARIPRSEPENQIEGLVNDARTQLQTVSEQFNTLLASSNLDQVTPVLANQTAELRSRLEKLALDLKRQYDENSSTMNERTANAVSETMSQLNATITRLQSQDPGTLVQGAEGLQMRFNEDLKSTADTVFAELSKLAKVSSQGSSNAQEELQQLTRTAVSRTADFFQQLQNQLKGGS